MAMPVVDLTMRVTDKEREDGYADSDLASVIGVRVAVAFLDAFGLRFEGSPDTGGMGSAVMEAVLASLVSDAVVAYAVRESDERVPGAQPEKQETR